MCIGFVLVVNDEPAESKFVLNPVCQYYEVYSVILVLWCEGVCSFVNLQLFLHSLHKVLAVQRYDNLLMCSKLFHICKKLLLLEAYYLFYFFFCCRFMYFVTFNITFPPQGWNLKFVVTGEDVCFHCIVCFLLVGL